MKNYYTLLSVLSVCVCRMAPSTSAESQKVTWSAPPGVAKPKPRSATGPAATAKVVSQVRMPIYGHCFVAAAVAEV